jgi:tRNA A-37 threonylcarbamoyl transferase component Bud32
MTPTIVHCPNPICQHVTHLGDDPLGRIFRCPHCLTKLPTAAAAAADSGWGFVLGTPKPGLQSARFRSPSTQPWDYPGSADRAVCGMGFSGLESGELLVKPFGLDEEESDELHRVQADLGSVGTSELFIGPFSRPGSLGREAESLPVSSVSAASACESGSAASAGDFGSVSELNLGRFRLLEVLGEGQHATVYRAYDPVLDRDVALKVPRRGLIKTAKALERFLGEAKALARLQHPRIVPVFEAGCAGARHYIAMALIEGRSLADRIIEGPLSIGRAVEIVADLAEALSYAHAEGIVHRDVKPANIRIDDRDAVYLMDFGIAYRPDSGEVPLPPGKILGTPAYVAPEQAQGGQTAVQPASDQYSLGVVLYELLCGQPPFCGPPSYVLFHAIHREPASPHTVDPKIPRAVAAICLKAISKRPERRHVSCQKFADELRGWLASEKPVAARRSWVRLRK